MEINFTSKFATEQENCLTFRHFFFVFEVGFYHNINKIKNCMKMGKMVVLLYLEELHDALYDMLNQRYTRIGNKLFCRIAMGAESVICPVHESFKCIVVASKLDAYTGKIPVAFLNRFEKQILDRRTSMVGRSGEYFTVYICFVSNFESTYFDF